MNPCAKQSVLLMFFALALLPAFPQTPAPQAGAVDPALLAKANGGDALSEIQVGDSYAAGRGGIRDSRQLTEDYKQAAGWYRKAADQGNSGAQVHLGDLYRDGRGVARDAAQAAAWYRKAAELGSSRAQGTLGILYSVGMGVSRDDVEAYYWLCLASSETGPDQAKLMANRQSVGEHITTDQQAAVEDRVAAWKAAHPRAGATQ